MHHSKRKTDNDPTESRAVTPNLTSDEYNQFQRFLEDAAGIMLGDNKHYLVTSRLGRVLADHNLASYTELLARVAKDARFREIVIDAMTTNETSWFRDASPFEIFKSTMLPQLARKPTGPIRIWSAACSTGQEPYSLSMCTHEFQMSNPGALKHEVEIVATDISPSSLQDARAGVYDEISIGRGLSNERRSRYFRKHGAGWEVRPEIRARVQFRALNLLQSYAGLGKFDAIFCRNVLIYFSSDLKSNVLQRMADALQPNGFLLLGGTETMSNYSDAFQMIRLPNGVIYQLKPR